MSTVVLCNLGCVRMNMSCDGYGLLVANGVTKQH